MLLNFTSVLYYASHYYFLSQIAVLETYLSVHTCQVMYFNVILHKVYVYVF